MKMPVAFGPAGREPFYPEGISAKKRTDRPRLVRFPDHRAEKLVFSLTFPEKSY